MFSMHTKWVSVMVMLLSAGLILGGCSFFSLKREDNSLLIASTKQFAGYVDAVNTGFLEANKDRVVMIQPGDATSSILALRNGAIDLAITSRDLNENEDDIDTRSYLIAKDALYIIVHPANPVQDLSMSQVKDIFTGKISNWKEFGGKDAPIQLQRTGSDSEAYTGLVDLVMDGEDVASGAIVQDTEPAMLSAVAADPQSIGFTIVRGQNNDSEVQIILINGVEATRETIYSGRYPLSRSVYVMIRAEASASAQVYMDYLIQDQGQVLLEQSGAQRLH